MRSNNSELFELDVTDSLKPFIQTISCNLLGDVKPEVTYTRIENNHYHFNLSFLLPEDVNQDDWQLTVTPSFNPSFHWSPHLTPTDEHIIEQHCFRSPALVMQDAQRTLILIPDLDILSKPLPVRWYMDMNAPENYLQLGMSQYKVKEHVLFVKEPGALYPRGTIEIGFYLLLFEDQATIQNPWRPVLDFLWSRWGSELYKQGEPVKAPLENYVEHTYNWAFDTWKDSVWQEFELDGKQVGAPVFIVNYTQSPNYPGIVNEREVRSIWNQAWFSSLRSAQGLFRFGLETGNEEYIRRARMTKELALSAPQIQGIFPSVIAAEMEEIIVEGQKVNRSKGWDTWHWGNSNRNPYTTWGSVKHSPFHVLDMSWTALLMLNWYEELEQDERLLEYAQAYADKLLTLQNHDGFFPAWLDLETLAPLEALQRSPESSLSVTFLLKLFEITHNDTYRKAALRAMDAVIQDIVYTGRWEDFETYWSCSTEGNQRWVGHKIERNNMYKQCNFSTYWTAEALLACYRTTQEQKYLQLGERCLDELLMTQASWQPPYIYVNALGGFGVMNCDGEWNDSRQSLFAELILQFGLELNRGEYVERSLAALKCSFAMMYCPENPLVQAQWEQAYPFFNELDYGFTMENYGHGGVVDAQGMGMGEFTIYDWGNGAAAESYMRIKAHYPHIIANQLL